MNFISNSIQQNVRKSFSALAILLFSINSAAALIVVPAGSGITDPLSQGYGTCTPGNCIIATTTGLSTVGNTTIISSPITNINSTTTNISSGATTTISGTNTTINATTTNINSSSTTITGTTTVSNFVIGTLTGFLQAIGG